MLFQYYLFLVIGFLDRLRLQNGRRGSEILFLQKGGAENVLAMLKGGQKRFLGIFFVCRSFHPLKGGGGPSRN